MSARAWIFFLCLSGMVTGGAWAASSSHAAAGPLTVKHARIDLDLQNQVCRLLWLGQLGSEATPLDSTGR